ncbi:hypothetical protein D3C73_1590570 [compost metagenome]
MLPFVQVLIKLKVVPKFAAVAVSLGSKKVRVVHVKVVSVLLNGRVAEPYLVRLRAAILTSCLRKFVVWRSNLLCLLR